MTSLNAILKGIFDVLKMYGKLCRAALQIKFRVEMARLAHLIVQLT